MRPTRPAHHAPARSRRWRRWRRWRPVTGARHRHLVPLLVALLTIGAAAAQPFAGTFRLPTDAGAAVTLVLEQQGAFVQGALDVDGARYQVEGEVDASGLYGYVYSAQEHLYFEAEPYGDGLYLIMASLDPRTGRPDPATAGEYLFERVAGAAAPAGAPVTPAPAGTTAGTAAHAAPALPADLQPAQMGRRYEAGSRVGSTSAGVSFVVPRDYYAGYLASENQFVIVSDTRPGLVVVRALTNMPLPEAVVQLSGAWQTSDTLLVPQGQTRVEGSVARASFAVSGPQGQGALHVVGVGGGAGNALLFGAFGAAHESEALLALAEELAASAVLSPPSREDARHAAAQLAGVQLSLGSSTSGGGYNDSHFSSSSTRLDLCSDGRYAYAYRSMTSVSVGDFGELGGVGASSSDSEEAYGRWSVESGLLGPVLVLRADDGSGDTYRDLHEVNGSLYLNTTPVNVGRSPNCG